MKESDSFIDKMLPVTLSTEELGLSSNFQIYEVYDAQFVDLDIPSCTHDLGVITFLLIRFHN